MEIDSSRSLVAVAIVLSSSIVLFGVASNAHALTVITVDDEDSCIALPTTGGSAIWNSDTGSCTIPEEATLQVAADEVLDLRVLLINAGIINNLQGGIIEIAPDNRMIVLLELNNFGTINIRAGAELLMADAFFYNAPSGIVNNSGEIVGTSDNPRFTNEGTINNQESGTIRIHDEMRLFNDPQGVINNHGFMHINLIGLVNNGTLNNYATANLVCSDEGGLCDLTASSRQGTLNNFGLIDVTSSFDTLHNVETISNSGEIRINNVEQPGEQLDDLVNDGTIINNPDGVIENLGRFSNPGVIDNQGVIANHCGATFDNSGTFTGNPVQSADDTRKPFIEIVSIIEVGTSAGSETLRIEGTTNDNGDDCGVQKVEVKVKDSVTFELFKKYELATVGAPDDGGVSRWTHEVTLDEEREYAIVARATDNAGNHNWYLTTFRVDFDAEPDLSRPTIHITTPVGPTVTITGPASGVTLDLEGTAADVGRGVARVQVKIIDQNTGELFSGYTLATATGPAGEDDYATWEKQLTFAQEGDYKVTARATDEVGKRDWSQVLVRVEFTDENL